MAAIDTGGFGAPPVQVIEQRGGGTLNFIRSVLESREKDNALNMAREAFKPVATTIADQIDQGDYNGAARSLSRQYYELNQLVAQKYPSLASTVAGEVVQPGFAHLAYTAALPQQAGGRTQSALESAGTMGQYNPQTGAVKLSQVARNTAAAQNQAALEGLHQEQTTSERELRPLVKGGQLSLAALRGSQAGLADETARGRAYNTNVVAPADVNLKQAETQKNIAEANKADRTTPGGPKGGFKTPALVQKFQRQLINMQDIGKMGLADSQRAQQQMQGELDTLNASAQGEGFPLRYQLDTSHGYAQLNSFAAPGAEQLPPVQQPATAPSPLPTVQGPTPGAPPPPTAVPTPQPTAFQPPPEMLQALQQAQQTPTRESLPNLGPPPAIPQIPAEAAPAPTPTQAPAPPPRSQGPGNVLDLSRIVPESVKALSAGQNVGASEVIRELAQRGITDPDQIKQVLQQLSGQ